MKSRSGGSLRVMQLLVFIEDKLGVMLPDHEVTPERIGTLKSLVEWTDSHRKS
jgi:acyl carrier protein